MSDKIIVAIGGGSLAEKTTRKIDAYVAELAKKHADGKRATGLFVGTASHDSMPYFNTFRKTYTSDFDIKADCALTVYGEMNAEKIAGKFKKADMVYVGGGDTLFMLDSWKKSGIYDLILDAYSRGVIICGLSAGAICWFDRMYTDSEMYIGGTEYAVRKGIGLLDGMCCPHFEERKESFSRAFAESGEKFAYALEGDSAAVFVDGKFSGALSSGGKAYKFYKDIAEPKLLEQL